MTEDDRAISDMHDYKDPEVTYSVQPNTKRLL